MEEEVVTVQPSSGAPSPSVEVSDVQPAGLAEGGAMPQPAGLEEGVEIRKMIASDSEIIGDMLVEGFEAKFLWSVGERNMEATRRYMGAMHKAAEKEYDRILVATYNGKPAGHCALKFHGDGELANLPPWDYLPCSGVCGIAKLYILEWVLRVNVGRQECYVDHICVDSTIRGKGLGKALLDAAEMEARSRGCNTMWLYVAEGNRARNLYERFGYTEIHTRDGCCCAWCMSGVRRFNRMDKRLQNIDP